MTRGERDFIPTAMTDEIIAAELSDPIICPKCKAEKTYQSYAIFTRAAEGLICDLCALMRFRGEGQ